MQWLLKFLCFSCQKANSELQRQLPIYLEVFQFGMALAIPAIPKMTRLQIFTPDCQLTLISIYYISLEDVATKIGKIAARANPLIHFLSSQHPLLCCRKSHIHMQMQHISQKQLAASGGFVFCNEERAEKWCSIVTISMQNNVLVFTKTTQFVWRKKHQLYRVYKIEVDLCQKQMWSTLLSY